MMAAFALLLGACSSGSLPDASVAPTTAYVPDPPADYVKLVSSAGTVQSLRGKSSYAPFEMSPLRRAVAPQFGDWVTCLRTSEGGRPIHYTVLMRGPAVSEIRMAVAVDNCEQEQYVPMPADDRS